MTPTILSEGAEIAGGRYLLERRLGAGGMATVWLALDTRLARRVAVKVPAEALTDDATFALRFEREAQTAAALSHPHLVAVFDYGTEGGRPYLVSEYVDGLSLAQITDPSQVPETEVLARTLLEALAHIHHAGIVHRDVKPGNVLVNRAGQVQLTDFGIAQSTEETSLTATGHVVGTESYLAPEVKRGSRAGPQSDLYSLGILLSEHLGPEDPDRVRRLVEALTREDPATRPAGAEHALEMLERKSVIVEPTTAMEIEPEGAIDRGRDGRPPREFPHPPPAPSGGGSRPRPVAAILAGLLIAAVVVAAVLIGTNGGSGGGAGRPDRAATTGKPPAPETSTVTEQTTTTVPADTTPSETTAPAPAPAAEPDPGRGAELNGEGYALLQQGDIAGALPKLEEAVASFPEDSTDIDYAYALFNYAQALRLSGDPSAAIPLLEKRLSISDFKVDEVNAELKAAQKDAKKAEKEK